MEKMGTVSAEFKVDLNANGFDFGISPNPFISDTIGVTYRNQDALKDYETCKAQLAPDSVFFEPNFGFKRTNGEIIMFGPDVGVKWRRWVGDNIDHFWLLPVVPEQESATKRQRVLSSPSPPPPPPPPIQQSLLVKLGKAIGGLLTMLHQNDQYVGNLSESLRIRSSAKSVTVRVVGIQKHSSFVEGVMSDLKAFRSIMEYIQEQSFQGREAPADLALYYRLLPSTVPSAWESHLTKRISYVFCHAPLFWEGRERMCFAGVLTKIRHLIPSTYRDVVQQAVEIDFGEWWTLLDTKGSERLRSYYNNEDTRARLAFYLRNCYAHFCAMPKEDLRTEFQSFDDEVVALFPGAFSKFYYTVSKIESRKFSLIAEFADCGLDYRVDFRSKGILFFFTTKPLKSR